MRRRTRKKILDAEIWKWIIKRDIMIYEDGLCRLEGLLGNSITFASLNATRDEIQNIRRTDGRLKHEYCEKLARFMSEKRLSSPLSNTELAILGITSLLSLVPKSSSISLKNKVSTRKTV